MSDTESDDQLAGFWFALIAYGSWGVIPVYFKLVAFATPIEIIAYRVGWAVVVLVLLILARRQMYVIRRLDWKKVGWLGVSGVLLTINWSVFVWALLNDHMLETSLGYYINPLINILLGGLFLGERLRRGQSVAVVLATLGVVNELVSAGVLPWVGLTLAITFGFYGLVRKKIAVDSVVGLGVETTLLLPFAIGYLAYLTLQGQGSLAGGDFRELGLLALGGAITVVPLVCFAAAALRLPLTVLGFFQYLAPSLTLLLAVLVYGEPFRASQAVTFGCIWIALVIFSAEGLYHQRRTRATEGKS